MPIPPWLVSLVYRLAENKAADVARCLWHKLRRPYKTIAFRYDDAGAFLSDWAWNGKGTPPEISCVHDKTRGAGTKRRPRAVPVPQLNGRPVTMTAEGGAWRWQR